MAGSISSSSYRGRFPWIFLMLLLQAACLTYDPSQPLDDATSIPPYKFQHIMEEIYPGASKVSMLSNVRCSLSFRCFIYYIISFRFVCNMEDLDRIPTVLSNLEPISGAAMPSTWVNDRISSCQVK